MKTTLGWDGKPTLLLEDGKSVLPRDAEDLLHKEYYPNGSGSWPIDPTTKQPMEAENGINHSKSRTVHSRCKNLLLGTLRRVREIVYTGCARLGGKHD